ncbi:MAG: BlaI/MecI/CopY family transcriptional regulator [Fimbriimonadaceae bacterium]
MDLSKRERQILEILYQRGESSAAEVQEILGDGSSYSAVRGMLRVLHEKELVNHRSVGAKYVFSPATPRDEAAKSALRRLVDTFFAGSIEQVVTTLLSQDQRKLSENELERLATLIQQAKVESK